MSSSTNMYAGGTNTRLHRPIERACQRLFLHVKQRCAPARSTARHLSSTRPYAHADPIEKILATEYYFRFSRKRRLYNTSWPARRCSGIRAPHWTLLELSRFAITQPRDERFTNEKDCFSLKCVGFDQKAILNRKECPSWTSLLSLHWVSNIPWHTQQRKLKSNKKS